MSILGVAVAYMIREQDPLKQGLKHPSVATDVTISEYS